MSEASAAGERISEKGWVRAQADTRFWIPVPETFPEEHDPATWFKILAEAWLEQSGLPYRPAAVEALALMIQRAQDAYARIHCQQVWVYLRDPFVTPLPVHIGIWKMQGERAARLRSLSGGDYAAPARPADTTEFVTDRLGAGIRAINYRTRKDRTVAMLAYAFRVEEFETELQIFTGTPDLRQLGNALGDIDEFVRGLTVFSAAEPQ
jgi:hypothetical protein